MVPVVVLGGSGLVGSRLLQLWRDRGLEVLAPSHAELDVTDIAALTAFLRDHRQATVVNLVAWADVDGAEAQRDDVHGAAYLLSAAYAGELARGCAELGIYLLHISTDYVFDGTNAERPYVETDATNPLCWYARTKAVGEHLVRNAGGEACIARIEMPFSAQPHRKVDFARLCLGRLRSGQAFTGVRDQRITPVFLDDAAEALRRLLALRVVGTVHVAASTWTTPYDFARGIAVRLGLDTDAVTTTSFQEFSATRPARRPQHSWLDVGKATALIGPGVLRSVDEQLDAWAAQLLTTPVLLR